MLETQTILQYIIQIADVVNSLFVRKKKDVNGEFR